MGALVVSLHSKSNVTPPPEMVLTTLLQSEVVGIVTFVQSALD